MLILQVDSATRRSAVCAPVGWQNVTVSEACERTSVTVSEACERTVGIGLGRSNERSEARP